MKILGLGSPFLHDPAAALVSGGHIVAAAEEEDADAIGLSMHNAGHLALAPSMLAALDEADLDIPLIIGGIIPEADVPILEAAGVAAILGPGAPAEEVVASVRAAVAARA